MSGTGEDDAGTVPVTMAGAPTTTRDHEGIADRTHRHTAGTKLAPTQRTPEDPWRDPVRDGTTRRRMGTKELLLRSKYP
ncbi:UNVERIFIED_CONTAM: hypothetical protein K2H54_057646 [Gekko kuhli]